MSKLVCSTSWHPVGCTFLDWSINYLSGQHKTLNRNLGWIKLVDNPVQNINAHGHKKNHPSGLEQTADYVNFLQQQSEFVTMYPFPLSFDKAALLLEKNISNIVQDDWAKIVAYVNTEYNQMLHWLDDHKAKIIFVATDKTSPLYFTNDRTQHQLSYSDQAFFKDSVSKWTELKLDNIWDVRERLALDTRPFDITSESMDLSFDHFWINSQDLWFNGAKKIVEILNWAEVDIDQSRVNQWTEVHKQWQRIQLSALEFQLNYQHIVDCVINGWSFPINLTFAQEVVIQHCLIYQHNLNLKTWQLEKFPSNTNHLHQLLEPNIHPVAKIY
jgi:hypothetical protein